VTFDYNGKVLKVKILKLSEAAETVKVIPSVRISKAGLHSGKMKSELASTQVNLGAPLISQYGDDLDRIYE